MTEQKIIVKQNEKDEEAEAVATRLFRWGYNVRRETTIIGGKKYKAIIFSK